MRNKKGNIAVIAIIIVIVAITAGVVGWMFAKEPQAPVQKVVVEQTKLTPTPIPVAQPAIPVVQPASVDETASWQTYSNTQFGFSLKIPTDWKGYTTTNLSKESLDGCAANINFNIPKWDGVFGIKICTKSQWAKLQKNAEYMANTQNLILGENNTYVYIFGQGMMLANGSDGVTDDTALAIQLKEVESIKKTFKITQ